MRVKSSKKLHMWKSCNGLDTVFVRLSQHALPAGAAAAADVSAWRADEETTPKERRGPALNHLLEPTFSKAIYKS
jgi:hypothetical protein